MSRVGIIGAILGLGLGGCQTPPPVRPLDAADRLFVAGDPAAADAYAAAASKAVDSNDELRARFFSLLARRATAMPTESAAMQEALRTFAGEASSTPWGRLAGLYADEMARTDALQQAVLRAGADLAQRDERIAAVERTLAERGEQNLQLSALITELKDEREKQARAQRELEDLLSSRADAIVKLENELEALKRIDLSRTP
jgi:hypothetical protein